MKCKKALFTSLAALSIISHSYGTIIIQIDVSDPNAVSFSATGATADTDINTVTSTDGITMLNFFTDNSAHIDYFDSGTDWAFSSSTLTPNGASLAYDSIGTLDYHGTGFFGAGNDLSFSRLNDFTAQDFSTASTAFTGIGIRNMIGKYDNTTLLPTVGTSGLIIAGWQQEGVTIGEWQAIPEPATIGLVGIFGVAIIMTRRFLRI